MRLVQAVSLVAVAGCGRFGFDETQPNGSGDAGGDARMTTGMVGPRWMKRFGLPQDTGLSGARGEVTVVQRFSSTFSGDGISLTGQGFESSALARYDVEGSVQFAIALDATGFCDMRDVIADGADTIVTGLTIGTQAIAAYGACSIATNRQDPIAIRVDAAKQQTVSAHWTASGANAQAWRAAQLTDGSLVISGIYSSGLMTDKALPAAQVDSNVWMARTHATATTATWSTSLNDDTSVHAGPVDAYGDNTCAMGAYTGPATLLGTALPHVGGYDTWFARVGPDGQPRFVRGLGSTLDEPSFSNLSSVAALPGGGCAIGIDAPGDVTFDGVTMPASQGRGLLVYTDDTGALLDWSRLPRTPKLAVVGDRYIVAFEVSSPFMIGDVLYTPDGIDTVIVEVVGDTFPILGVVGGAGDQMAAALAAAADDAVAIIVGSTGALAFGATSWDTGTTKVNAVGVLGI